MDGIITIIAPDEKFTQLSIETVNELGENIKVLEGSYSEGLLKAKDAIKNGTDIIISRGGTGNLIKRNVDIPVVNIDFSSYDVLSSVYKAVKHSQNIGIVGFGDLANSYKNVKEIIESIFDSKISICTVKSVREIEGCVIKLYRKGCRVFIGGNAVLEIVDKYNFRGILIETGKAAIIDSIRYAKRLYEVQSVEKEKAEILKSIIDFAYEGILAIDDKNNITVYNPIIERITGISHDKAIGKQSDEIVENSRMKEVLKTGESELGEIQKIGSMTILTNRVPIKVDDKIVGVVATFQEIEKIQDMETQIRSKLYAKGHVAKIRFDGIIGSSHAIKDAKEKALLYSKVESTVLIQGETGTGKELFAQSIHNSSNRKDKPFVTVNCAALHENLLESELFGYVEGAFTGARKGGKIGLFEMAHGGTIFLDEISEMPKSTQARFLRVLQEKEVVRLGDDKIIPIDIRIIAATNRELFKEVENLNFREDLYYRLCVLTLVIPPLRVRKTDIGILIDYFIKEKSKILDIPNKGISDAAKSKLLLSNWPGNVRQLENFIERCLVISRGNEISLEIVNDSFGNTNSIIDTESNQLTDIDDDIQEGVLKEVERNTILSVLEETGGNKKLAAEKLGMSTTTLWRRLKDMQK